MRIFAEYSLWFLPICVLVGVGVSVFLYAKDTKMKDVPSWIRRFLFVLRAFVVATLLFLLLGPFVERIKKQLEQPTIVVLHDNSSSLVLQKDSTLYRTSYKADLHSFVENLGEKYRVDFCSFSDFITRDTCLEYNGLQTNLSGAIQDVSTQYYNQNIGAVVLCSDGIYNVGENPKYAINSFPPNMPIYTVALGDTVQECDNLVTRVLCNQIAFRDNPFAVKVSLESHALKGKTMRVRIFDGDHVAYETSFTAQDTHVYKTVDCKITTSSIGKKIYTVEIEHFDEEISELNNRYSFAVDVLESRQKIAIVYASVHPDVAAIRRAIEGNKNYECSVFSLQDGNLPDMKGYNCVVLVGLPGSVGKGKSILNDLIQEGIPTFVVFNSATSIENINSLHLGVEISSFRGSFDEAKPRVSLSFSNFSIEEETKDLFLQAPPLMVPYGTYSVEALSNVLAYQNVGDVELDRPLVWVSLVQNTKIGVVAGEGLWRWRMYDYKLHGSFSAFDSFVNKVISYIALSETRDLFAVRGESVFSENQNVVFTAELYDKRYEPMKNQEISMVIKNEDGTEYPFSFAATDNFYTLEAGRFPQGTYTYTATVSVDGVVLKRTGSFFVLPLLAEYSQTRANHDVLRSLSEQTGGIMVFPNQLETLLDTISANRNIVSVAHSSRNRSLLIDIPFVLIVLLISASLEWFLRKYYATY